MPANRILYVIGSLDIGGTERHLSLIAPRLKRLGWEPIVYCIARRGAQADAVEKAGVEVIGPPFEQNRPKIAGGKFVYPILSCLRLFKLLLFRRPRFVHFFLPMAYILGAPLALLSRAPDLIMSRRSLNLYQKQHRVLRFLELHLHKHMSAILGNSGAVVRELIDQEKCDPSRVGLIYNGIEAADPAPNSADASAGAGEPGLTLIVVANLIPYKGHRDLIQALGTILPKLPERWKLLCVGRDDGIGVKLASQARELNLESHIHFLGVRTDVAALLRAADIGILCSHEEGFSNAILEGMAASLPMIVTDVGGNTEAVVRGNTALVVPPRDPAALAEAILTLSNDAGMRKRMGQNGRARINERFLLDRCVERYHALYQGLNLGQRPAGIDGIGSSASSPPQIAQRQPNGS